MPSLISRVCNLPREFASTPARSITQLLTDAGYFEAVGQVTHESVLAELIAHPELLDDWRLYSENKRTSSGWYWEGGSWIGFHPNGPTSNFKDVRTACAAFVIRELADIRQSAQTTELPQ